MTHTVHTGQNMGILIMPFRFYRRLFFQLFPPLSSVRLSIYAMNMRTHNTIVSEVIVVLWRFLHRVIRSNLFVLINFIAFVRKNIFLYCKLFLKYNKTPVSRLLLIWYSVNLHERWCLRWSDSTSWITSPSGVTPVPRQITAWNLPYFSAYSIELANLIFVCSRIQYLTVNSEVLFNVFLWIYFRLLTRNVCWIIILKLSELVYLIPTNFWFNLFKVDFNILNLFIWKLYSK